jgi:hypothetical protein
MPRTKTLCQLCRRLVRIVSLPMPASFKTECTRTDCPINADCTSEGKEAGEVPLFAYRVSFAELELQ